MRVARKAARFFVPARPAFFPAYFLPQEQKKRDAKCVPPRSKIFPLVEILFDFLPDFDELFVLVAHILDEFALLVEERGEHFFDVEIL